MNKQEFKIKAGELSFGVIALLIGSLKTGIISYVLIISVFMVIIYLFFFYFVTYKQKNDTIVVTSPIINSINIINSKFKSFTEMLNNENKFSKIQLGIISEELEIIIKNYEKVLRHINDINYYNLLPDTF